MKEQKQRYGDKTLKENMDAVTPKEGASKPERPQLSIAISMSEEDEDPGSQTPRDRSPLATLAHIDVANDDVGNDVSVWAMMEHYEMGERASPRHLTKGQDGLSESALFKDTSSMWDKSFTREQGSLQLSPESQDSSCSEATPSTITRTTQHIFVPNHAEEMPSPVNGSGMFKWNLYSPPVAQNLSHFHEIKESESERDNRPTPAKLKAQWIEEKKYAEDLESPPVSLLQESLILSDDTLLNTTAPSFRTLTSDTNIVAANDEQTIDPSSLQAIVPFDPLDDDSVTDLSKASIQLSANVAEISHKMMKHRTQWRPLQQSTPVPTGTAKALVVRTSEMGGDRADFAHLEKIEQLERDLKMQKANTDQMQIILKERVVELEHALRATVTTPRGTIVQENPLKTLLDRNQTLVKEVRFADSTCVELSAKVSALEAEKQILQGQVTSLQKENKALRADYEHSLIQTPSLSRSDDQKNESSSSRYFLNEGGVLRQAMNGLKAEVSVLPTESQEPFVSQAMSLLSDIDCSLDREFDENSGALDTSFVSQCLAKALQAQVRLLKEQKRMAKENQVLEEQHAVAQSRNEDLDLQLRKERLKENTADDSRLSLDLSRAQEESDFLGRQLGRVQESLDKARQELEGERKKSVAIDSKWRTETAGHLRQIRLLEEKLDRASKSLSIHNNDDIGLHNKRHLDNQVIHIEQELLNAKANLISFKKNMETLLSQDVYDRDGNASCNHDSEIMGLVVIVAERMRLQYSNLNLQVEQIVTQYCSKVEHLTETVKFLRSSLLFEADSVSTATAQAHHRHEDSPRILEWTTSEADDDEEDDMYSRMEEARVSPRHNNHVDDVSSDLDDISRLFSDDSTLESMLRTAVSEKTAFWEFDALKKPLEAAIRECQRVRDRSIALKDELKSEKFAFAQLEMENRRILLEYSRKDEEKQLVQEALEEAKAQIQDLHSRINDLIEENSKQKEKCSGSEIRLKNLEAEKRQLEGFVHDAINKRDETDGRMAALQSQMDEAQQKMKSAHALAEERERAYISLQSRMEDIETHAFETEDMLLESRCKQEDMRKERAELKAQVARSESEIQSIKESSERANMRSQKQIEEMSTVINLLESQRDEVQTMLRHFSNVYHDIFELFDRSDKVSFSKPQHKLESASGVDWSLLAQVVPFISSTLDDIAQKQAEIEMLQTDILRLQQDFQRSTELGSQYQKQVEDEKAQNKKLAELLQQAEQEMERSVDQIREMSSALSQLQQQEAGMVSRNQSLEQEREAMREELLQAQNALSNERKLSHQRGNELSHELSTKQKREEEFRSTIDSLESKSTRLREYVKKLTLKCEEWEKSYERQGKSFDKLQSKHARMREKTCEMAAKYKQLSGHVKSKSRVSSYKRSAITNHFPLPI